MWYTPSAHTHTHTHTPTPPFLWPFRKKQHTSAPVTVHLLDKITLRKNVGCWNVPKECWNVLKETLKYVKKRSTAIKLFMQIQISFCLPLMNTWLCKVSSHRCYKKFKIKERPITKKLLQFFLYTLAMEMIPMKM